MRKFAFVFGIFIFLLIYFIQSSYVNSQTSFRGNYYPLNQPYKQNANFAARDNVLIILDSSYSMSEKINGERKIDIAKRAIGEVLSNLSPDVSVGLRVYGHKGNFLGIGACKASELKVPVGANNRSIISNQLLSIKPTGWTPITYSIRQAVDFDFAGVSGKKRIILLSDGMETCDGSPCDYAVQLVKSNIDLKIDVIGFGLTEPAADSQLKCTALATKGKYYTANSAGELLDRLNKSFNISKDVQGQILKY